MTRQEAGDRGQIKNMQTLASKVLLYVLSWSCSVGQGHIAIATFTRRTRALAFTSSRKLRCSAAAAAAPLHEGTCRRHRPTCVGLAKFDLGPRRLWSTRTAWWASRRAKLAVEDLTLLQANIATHSKAFFVLR
jgi:hypothetical protein